MDPRNRSRNWVHAIARLHGWWLPGDRRGFRSRRHRIHSSGDYRNPPPPEEHAGLRVWAQSVSTRVPALTVDERASAGAAVVEVLQSHGRTPLAVACASTHLHALFGAGDESATQLFGKANQLAAHRVGRRSGRLWAQGAGFDRIRTRGHQHATFHYILAHAADGAWVWRFDEGVSEPSIAPPPDKATDASNDPDLRRRASSDPASPSAEACTEDRRSAGLS